MPSTVYFGAKLEKLFLPSIGPAVFDLSPAPTPIQVWVSDPRPKETKGGADF